MLVSGYNNIILMPNCTMLYYVFSGPLSLRAYVPEIKFNNTNNNNNNNNNNGRNGSCLTWLLPHRGKAQMTCNYRFPTMTMF